MKIVQLVGARPQFVKLAPVSKQIRKNHQEIIVHSGQHYDYQMNEVFFKQMQIPKPDYDLNVGSGSHGVQTARILEALEAILIKEEPDWLLIYGDTNTTLAGALAASKLGIKTAHIEAGLRSFNRSMPEEINRIVADHLSELLLVPTQTGMDNLKHEGLLDKAKLVGDVMTDSLIMGVEAARKQDIKLITNEPYSVLTLHRPYNVDDPDKLQDILKKLNTLGQKVIFPVHPRTQRLIAPEVKDWCANIIFIDPLGYLDFLTHLANAQMILTDSGGIQKEAYILKKPCVTLRTETEWVETVSSGWNLLLDPSDAGFPEVIKNFKAPQEHPDLFGVDVSKKIVEALEV
jgi:UDP-N-acetylglucosamine 2-epimerase